MLQTQNHGQKRRDDVVSLDVAGIGVYLVLFTCYYERRRQNCCTEPK